jgi:hypothetical protein
MKRKLKKYIRYLERKINSNKNNYYFRNQLEITERKLNNIQ